MSDCQIEGFFCTTHRCGIAADGGLQPCGKPGCPHCQKGKQKKRLSERAYQRLQADHLKAQDAMIRWEDKLGRALGKLQSARAEERRIRLRLEKAEQEGLEPSNEEVVP